MASPKLLLKITKCYWIQQGDNLTLTILQAGYGNTLRGDATQRSRFTLLVPSLILDLIQDGNTNDMFGSWVLDGSGLVF